ncbi:tetratricopeptide repeat protein [Planctomyces sp. SH-PL62]|uniref:tetratricopeptide repeat protein n=1 Tax=Planctomyces sp. SH-PL62 TaxID=1636152 RepID=UPI00078E7C32|nr:tetratricopeptide repeat protein [Planctomyces sp. SH-PL62]AMV37577.1 tetratricopeptide repeat protein [Planctomyces sp. SH-PL62]
MGQVSNENGRTPRGGRIGLARLVLALLAAFLGGAAYGQDSPASAPAPPARMPEALRFAHGLFRQRKFDMAAEEYAKFLETDPGPPHGDDARFGLASARLLQGLYQESRAAFQEFIRRAPEHPRARTAWYRLGELSYMLGDLPAAREALERFTADPADHPNLETAWTYLGDVRSALDDPAGARAAYERSLKAFPDARLADRARYGLGRALAAMGETQPALDVLEDLIRREPPEWVDKARLQVGRIELAAGRFDAAEKSLAKVAGPGPLQAEARLRRAQALMRLERLDEAADLLRPLAADPAEPASLEASLDAAHVDLRRGRAEDALKVLDAAIPRAGESPLAPALLYRSAEALRSLGRIPEAREGFLKAAEAAPTASWADDARLEAVRLAHQAGDHDAAQKLAEDFAAKFPDSKLLPDALLIEARSATAAKRPEAAVAALEKLIGDGSKPVEAAPEILDAARYELALAYRAVGKPERAEAILATLAKSGGKGASADAAFLLGQAHLEAGRFAEAAAAFENSLEAAPDGQVADYALAYEAAAYLGLDRRDDAVAAIGRLSERFPRSLALPPARLRVAEALAKAGELPKAVEQFRPLVESAESVPADLKERAELGLARAQAKQGDAEAATKTFDAILAKTTDEARAAALGLERAGVLETTGKPDEAIAAYEAVEARAPKLDAALHAALARARLLAKDHPQQAADLLGKLLEGEEARARLKAIGQPIDALIADRGWDLIDAGKIDEADEAFAELLRDFPDGPYGADARFNLAESANERKDFAEVVRLLAPLLEPGSPDAPRLPERLAPDVLYRLGRTRIERGEWAEAAATLDRLIAEAPASPRIREARFLRAEAALRQDQFEAAEKALAELIAAPASPDDPPDLVRLARERRVQCLLGLKRWQDALDEADALKGTIAEPAAKDPVEFARGRALLGLGRLDDARAAFQAVIDSRKSGDLAAQAQLMRGEAYFHEEQFLQALREFLQVDILYNNAPRRQAAALLEAGKVYERLARWSEAAETYERLTIRFPEDPCAAEAGKRREAVLAEHGAKP